MSEINTAKTISIKNLDISKLIKIGRYSNQYGVGNWVYTDINSKMYQCRIYRATTNKEIKSVYTLGNYKLSDIKSMIEILD